MSISAALATVGMDYDTNGNNIARFWNFTVNLGAVESVPGIADRPAHSVPVTFMSTMHSVGAIVAIRPTRPIDDILPTIHQHVAMFAQIRFQANQPDVGEAFIRADTMWHESIATPFPAQLFMSLWQSAVSMWIMLDIQFPNRFELVEAAAVPETRLALLTPNSPSIAPPEQQG